MTTTTTACSPTSSPTSPSVMRLLKEGTQDLHDAAERHPLERALLKGSLPKSVYAARLGQHFLVYEALEKALRKAKMAPGRFGASIAAVVDDEQFHAKRVAADLADFGVDSGAVEPLPETRELLSRLDAAVRKNPPALLGFHYVLEGSTNGARFIAKALRKAYNLAGDAGVRSLDPYGEDQQTRWAAFKETMDAQGFAEVDAQAMLAAARDMFSAITAIDQAIARSHNLAD